MDTTSSRWNRFLRRKQTVNRNIKFSELPSYGTVYLNHLIGEFDALKGRSSNECACQMAQELVERAKRGEVLTWGDAYSLERAVLLMLPDEEVHQRLWCLEMRYKDAVGDSTAYDNFLKVDAQHLVSEQLPHARARLDNLIRELYRLYTVIACRENLRAKLTSEAMWTVVVAIVLLMVLMVVQRRVVGGAEYPLYTFGIVFAAGAIGGLVSFERRVQSLSNRGESLGDLVELSSGSGIYLSPLSGGVFAIVLYIIFTAGLATGIIFPKFDGSSSQVKGFLEFVYHIQPISVEDWGKLLIWSFIAGFAERFVPDTLDRLIARREDKKKQSV
jgi:hypothetical protein